MRIPILLLVLPFTLIGCNSDGEEAGKPPVLLNSSGKPRTAQESDLEQKNKQGGENINKQMEEAARAQREAKGGK